MGMKGVVSWEKRLDRPVKLQASEGGCTVIGSWIVPWRWTKIIRNVNLKRGFHPTGCKAAFGHLADTYFCPSTLRTEGFCCSFARNPCVVLPANLKMGPLQKNLNGDGKIKRLIEFLSWVCYFLIQVLFSKMCQRKRHSPQTEGWTFGPALHIPLELAGVLARLCSPWRGSCATDGTKPHSWCLSCLLRRNSMPGCLLLAAQMHLTPHYHKIQCSVCRREFNTCSEQWSGARWKAPTRRADWANSLLPNCVWSDSILCPWPRLLSLVLSTLGHHS